MELGDVQIALDIRPQLDTSRLPAERPRISGGHRQPRKQRRGTVFQRDPGRREPQVTLHRIARSPGQPVRRIRAPVLRPQLRDIVAEPRTRGSNRENDVGARFRSYFGGTSEATAPATVDLPTPRSRATCRCGTPSATSRRINAQSSTEITQPICLGGLIFDRHYGLIFERRRQWQN
jgi:hypothetical protein